jgi:predicted alpha/beta superfamily hydrolase
MRIFLLTSSLMVLFGCLDTKTTGSTTISKSNIVFDTLEGRALQIYLPPGHSDQISYPVLYMHDGQNLFLDSTSYAGEWGVDEILDSMISGGLVAPMLVVGINNSARRAEEYVPYNDDSILEMMHMNQWDGGLHIFFADFISYELIPYIEKTYSGSTAKSDLAIAGSSLGGLQAIWMGINYADIFGFVGAFSPSIWVGDGALIRELHSYDSLPVTNAWIDIGAKEYDPRFTELISNLDQKGWSYGQNLWYYLDPTGEHNERSWNSRFGNLLQLFKGLTTPAMSGLEVSVSNVENQYGREQKLMNPMINAAIIHNTGLRYSAMRLAAYESSDWTIDPWGEVLSRKADTTTIKVSVLGASAQLKITD